MTYVQITNNTDGYHAGRIDGQGRYGYVIYGESSIESLAEKLDAQGHKYDMPEEREARDMRRIIDAAYGR